MTDTTKNLPHWDLSNVYPGLDSPEYKADFHKVIALIGELESYLELNNINRDHASGSNDLSIVSDHTSELLDHLTRAYTLVYTLHNYIYSFTTTDSYDTLAMRQYSKIQSQVVRILQAEKVIAGWLGGLGGQLDEIITTNPDAGAHAFYLQESAEQSQYLMSEAEEALATELSLSGSSSWEKLQGVVKV